MNNKSIRYLFVTCFVCHYVFDVLIHVWVYAETVLTVEGN